MNYRAWQLKNADTAGESALLAAGYGPLLARVLACRGIAQPQAAAALLEEEPPLSDPFLLKDMDKAVARIQQAIENGETIVIFGDYDVDGVSATAILYECLTNLGAQVRCKLPTREGGGYGLNRETLQKLADKGYKLIVTVDNGISAIEEADLAAELGIELLLRGAREGERKWLPPATHVFRVAPPGAYNLRSTEETVVDPDFTSQWVLVEPDA